MNSAQSNTIECRNATGRVVTIPISEIELTAIRSEGPGGQHVNKTSSAIQLRFNIASSSLPEDVKAKLLALHDHRITDSGDIIIKVQDDRSMLRNRETAYERFRELIEKVLVIRKKRRPTKPTKSSIEKRLTSKKTRSFVKKMRGKVED